RENPYNPINRRISIIVMTRTAEARALSSDAPDVDAAREAIEMRDVAGAGLTDASLQAGAAAAVAAALERDQQDTPVQAQAQVQASGPDQPPVAAPQPTSPQPLAPTPAGRARQAAAAAEAALSAAGIGMAGAQR